MTNSFRTCFTAPSMTVQSAIKCLQQWNTKRLSLSLISAALISAPSIVQASVAVLNFEDQAIVVGTTNNPFSDFNSNGYHFNSKNNHFHFSNQDSVSRVADSGSTNLFVHDNFSGSKNILTLTEVGNGPFTLTSADFAESFATDGTTSRSTENAISIGVIGFLLSGGTLSMSVILDGLNDSVGGINDFQTITFNWTNLTRVEFTGVGGRDSSWNIDQVHGVSEPGSLALIGLALLGITAVGRRNKTSFSNG